MASFLVNSSSGEQVDLGPVTMLGRSPESNVTIDDPHVSRRHAMIRKQNDGYWLYDLGSFNGSLLNGQRVTTTQKLESGDVVTVGAEEFRFQEDQSTKILKKGDQSSVGSTIAQMRTLHVIVLVSDIRNYTTLSEQLEPGDLAQVIGSWYRSCDELLSGYGATVDKFIGDAVLSYWTETTPETKLNALRASAALIGACEEIFEEKKDFFGDSGLGFRSGVSLGVGRVACGQMGSGEFTLVGDAVNIAFRLQELTRTLGADVLVDVDYVRDWIDGRKYLTSLGEQKIKGKKLPLEVFALTEVPPAAEE